MKLIAVSLVLYSITLCLALNSCSGLYVAGTGYGVPSQDRILIDTVKDTTDIPEDSIFTPSKYPLQQILIEDSYSLRGNSILSVYLSTESDNTSDVSLLGVTRAEDGLTPSILTLEGVGLTIEKTTDFLDSLVETQFVAGISAVGNYQVDLVSKGTETQSVDLALAVGYSSEDQESDSPASLDSIIETSIVFEEQVLSLGTERSSKFGDFKVAAGDSLNISISSDDSIEVYLVSDSIAKDVFVFTGEEPTDFLYRYSRDGGTASFGFSGSAELSLIFIRRGVTATIENTIVRRKKMR